MTRPELTPDYTAFLAKLGLAGVNRVSPHCVEDFPHWGDPPDPRKMHPAFFGCYDWHSAVHTHWMLVRLLRFSETDADWRAPAMEALQRHLTPVNIAGEIEQLKRCRAAGVERPYGWAWLLQLSREVVEANETELAGAIEPLEQLCRDRFCDWVSTLEEPMRTGEHTQSAFAMGLGLDSARRKGDAEFETALCEAAIRFHQHDHFASLAGELSAYDFLSPSLAAADLMRRVLPADQFADWWRKLFSDPNQIEQLQPVVCRDPADGKLSHWDGLNLSRAWMMEGIAQALGTSHSDYGILTRSATAHGTAGINAIDPAHYAGTHWLGSFATYYLTRRGK